MKVNVRITYSKSYIPQISDFSHHLTQKRSTLRHFCHRTVSVCIFVLVHLPLRPGLGRAFRQSDAAEA